jgi:TonB family protein
MRIATSLLSAALSCGLAAWTQGPAPAPASGLRVLSRPPMPASPLLAEKGDIVREVLLEVTIDAQGHPTRVRVDQGPDELWDLAQDYVKAWTFEPVLTGGVPGVARDRLRIPFRMATLPEAEVVLHVRRAVLDVAVKVREGAPELDAGKLETSVRESLTRAGIEVVREAGAKAEETHHLRLMLFASRTPSGLLEVTFLGRCSLLADRALPANSPGQTKRVWNAAKVLGMADSEGWQEAVAGALCRLAETVGGLPSPVRPAIVTGARAPASAPGLQAAPPTAAPSRQAAAAAPRTLSKEDLLRIRDGRVPEVAPRQLPHDSGPLAFASAPSGFAGGGVAGGFGGKVVDFDFSQVKIRHQPKPPPYPAIAKMAKVQGTVVVELTIDTTGRPCRAETLGGPLPLQSASVQYSLEWRFEPALINGVPQVARFRLTMPYRLF